MDKEKYDNYISVTEEELIEFWGETPESIAELAKDEEMWARGEIPPGTTEVRMGRPRLEDLCEPVAFSHKEPPGKASLIRNSAKNTDRPSPSSGAKPPPSYSSNAATLKQFHNPHHLTA
ncbi:MAG: hypothetical protein IKZ87_09210 [Actinomycetaceae bacterium]|nr:hypothetical protein [Actinomycetaceae bacterium]